jgi:hypothetical protein
MLKFNKYLKLKFLLFFVMIIIFMIYLIKNISNTYLNNNDSFFNLSDSISTIILDKNNNDYIKLITFSNGNNILYIKSENTINQLKLELQGNIVIEYCDDLLIGLKSYVSTNIESYQKWIDCKAESPDYVGKYKIEYKIEKFSASSIGEAIIVDSLNYNSENFSLFFYNNNIYVDSVKIKDLIFSNEGTFIRIIENGNIITRRLIFKF